jgi:hypothetical protein
MTIFSGVFVAAMAVPGATVRRGEATAAGDAGSRNDAAELTKTPKTNTRCIKPSTRVGVHIEASI